MFVTTNNAYHQHLNRGNGAVGLNALFDDTVKGLRGRQTVRTIDMPRNWTTDVQAEVLYPSTLSTEYLAAIYVYNETDRETAAAAIGALSHVEVPIVVSKELFSA